MPQRVLVIDDRLIVLKGIKRLLERQTNAVIDIVTSFSSACECLSKEQYDVISTDLNMPRITKDKCFDESPGTTFNGWIFLKHFIFLDDAPYKDRCKKTKIIIFSGYVNELVTYINNLPKESSKEKLWLGKTTLVNKNAGEYDALIDTITKYLN